MPLDISKAPATASPLWIIALFIALSEATAGVAAITTNGAARLIFAIFAVSFPVVVFAGFVWLLVRHTPKLYAPGQYSKDITPEAFSRGVTRTEIITIGRAFGKSVAPLVADGDSEADVVERVARDFEVAVAQSSVRIFTERLKPGSDVLQIPVSEETTVDSLLDSIYFAIAPTVKPFTYGQMWVLTDDNGAEYTDIGTLWARNRNMPRDHRHITEVGILPGTSLTAIAKGSTEKPTPSFRRQLNVLVKDLSTAVSAPGIKVEPVSGPQRPRLLVHMGPAAYGLYVMPGNPKGKVHWIELAKAASAELEADRGFPITPVLALDRDPPEALIAEATSSNVAIMWLQHGKPASVPWAPPAPRLDEAAEALDGAAT